MEEQLTRQEICAGVTGVWIYQFLKPSLDLAKNEK